MLFVRLVFEKTFAYIKLTTNLPPNHLICRQSFPAGSVRAVRVKTLALTLALTTETPINRAFQTKSEGVRAKKEKNFFLF